MSDYFISEISMDIPYTFLIHSIYLFPGYVPCIFHMLSTFCPHFAPCSTFCPHFVFIFSTFWKLREVYMLKNTPHDSLFNFVHPSVALKDLAPDTEFEFRIRLENRAGPGREVAP